MSHSPLSLTVIIPTLNEAEWIASCIDNVRARLPTAKILIVDGGSQDETIRIADDYGASVIHSSKGRGLQMHTAAQQTESDALLFLHADTLLPNNSEQILSDYFSKPDNQIATFRLSFDQKSWFLSACAWLTRFDTVFTRFGDQGIAIKRDFYHQIGGFPEWPLFEDVELLRIARRQTSVRSLRAYVTTSSRRFDKRGMLSQQWLNTRLLCRFLLGTSPETLAARYRS